MGRRLPLGTPQSEVDQTVAVMAADGSIGDGTTPGVPSPPISAPVITGGGITQNATTGQYTFTDNTSTLVLDTAGYGSLSLQVSSAANTIVVSWGENPTGPFFGGTLVASSSNGSVAEIGPTTASVAALYIANSQARYAQIRATAAVSITVDIDLNRDVHPNRGCISRAVSVSALPALPPLQKRSPLWVYLAHIQEPRELGAPYTASGMSGFGPTRQEPMFSRRALMLEPHGDR